MRYLCKKGIEFYKKLQNNSKYITEKMEILEKENMKKHNF